MHDRACKLPGCCLKVTPVPLLQEQWQPIDHATSQLPGSCIVRVAACCSSFDLKSSNACHARLQCAGVVPM